MKTAQIESSLNKLQDLVNRIRAQKEWHKLKQMENNQISPSRVNFADNTLNEVSELIINFQTISSQLWGLLRCNGSPISISKRNNFTKKLTKLDMEVRYLGNGRRFY